MNAPHPVISTIRTNVIGHSLRRSLTLCLSYPLQVSAFSIPRSHSVVVCAYSPFPEFSFSFPLRLARTFVFSSLSLVCVFLSPVTQPFSACRTFLSIGFPLFLLRYLRHFNISGIPPDCQHHTHYAVHNYSLLSIFSDSKRF
jgi:hypothetical protein